MVAIRKERVGWVHLARSLLKFNGKQKTKKKEKESPLQVDQTKSSLLFFYFCNDFIIQRKRDNYNQTV